MSDLAEKLEQIKALHVGLGLQYLLDEAYRILGNPSLIFNMEYQLLAHAQNVVTDDPLWNEIVTNGQFCEGTILFFATECFVDSVASTKSTVVLTSDQLKYDRLYGRIFNKDNHTVADLVMVACDKALEQEDQTVFEAICQKISQEISANAFYQRYGIHYHENWICRLLDGKIQDRVSDSDHIANLYERLKTNLYLAVADIRRCDLKQGGLAAMRDLLKQTQPEFLYAIHHDYVVIVISTEDDVLDEKRALNKLNKLFAQNKICLGISGCFSNLFELRKYYDEAVYSLKSAENMIGVQE